MESPGLAILVVQLMAAVYGLTGHPVPATAPEIEFVPQAFLAERACGKPCAVLGWYGGERVVYLDDRLSPEDSLWDRGILVHELVHYMQEQDGAYGVVPNCERWMKREREAYDIQQRWLMANRRPGARRNAARFPTILFDCRP